MKQDFFPRVTQEDETQLKNNLTRRMYIRSLLNNKESHKMLVIVLVATIFAGICFFAVTSHLGFVTNPVFTTAFAAPSSASKDFAKVAENGAKDSLLLSGKQIVNKDSNMKEMDLVKATVVEKKLHRPNPFSNSVRNNSFKITFKLDGLLFERHGDLILRNMRKSFGLDPKTGNPTDEGLDKIMDAKIKTYQGKGINEDVFLEINITNPDPEVFK